MVATTARSLYNIRFEAKEDRTRMLVDRYILKYKNGCFMPPDEFLPTKTAPVRKSRHEMKKTNTLAEDTHITKEVAL
jgi:hypothetical protein